MSDNTAIEWADATLNYINGCSVVSPGCTNCYAMRLAGTRLQHHPSRAGLTKPSKAGPVWTGEVRAHEPALRQALAWKRPRRIFWNAHGDLFHENVPDEWIDKLFAVCALTPQHTHMILTKRPERMRAYFTHDDGFGRWGFIEHWAKKMVRGTAAAKKLEGKTLAGFGGSNLPNVWLGTSVEDHQHRWRIDELGATPAAVRFVSFEPLLGRVDVCEQLGIWWNQTTGEWVRARKPLFDWAIVGGESGPGARPMHPDWARSLRCQCQAAGVAFHFKQWGEWRMAGDDLGKPPKERTVDFWRVGKKAAGRLLDGRTWDEFPA